MAKFNFSRLIKKYSVKFAVTYPSAQSRNDLGQKIFVPERIVMEEGALIPMPQRMIFQSGGTLTEFDRMLYTKNHNIPNKAKIVYKGVTYTVMNKMPLEEHADFTSYSLKGVSSFD